MNSVNYLPHLPRSRTSLGKVYLHLKLNLAKLNNQEAYPNYTHSVMET